MTLNYERETVFNECIELKAIVRSFPKHTCVKWMKGSEKIDTNLPKYRGSSENGNVSILRVNNATDKDEDIYTVKVYNRLGEGTCSSKKLKVIGGKILFCLFDYSLELNIPFLNYNSKCSPSNELTVWRVNL